VASNTPEASATAATTPSEFERPVIRAQSPDVVENPPEVRIASAPQGPVAPEDIAQPLPKTPASEAREVAPGWRRIREQMQGIPADFVNPAIAPNLLADESALQEAVGSSTPSAASPPMLEGEETTQPPSAGEAFPKASASQSPQSNEPAFRFELDQPLSNAGGQNSVFGRSPNWSDFPRNPASRDPAQLEPHSERPFSP
jgi:hypothetical protein